MIINGIILVNIMIILDSIKTLFTKRINIFSGIEVEVDANKGTVTILK